MKKHNIGELVIFKCKDTEKRCGGIIRRIDRSNREDTILLIYIGCKNRNILGKAKCQFLPYIDDELEPTEEEKLKAIKVLIVGGGNEEVDKV